jgi:hypothetical protein
MPKQTAHKSKQAGGLRTIYLYWANYDKIVRLLSKAKPRGHHAIGVWKDREKVPFGAVLQILVSQAPAPDVHLKELRTFLTRERRLLKMVGSSRRGLERHILYSELVSAGATPSLLAVPPPLLRRVAELRLTWEMASRPCPPPGARSA